MRHEPWPYGVLATYFPLLDREFRRCVVRYHGDRRPRGFSCWDQFLCMAFAQPIYRESLRDIEVCLRSCPDKLYHMGIRGRVSRSTLADANERHDWRIFADFAQILIPRARQLYALERFGEDLQPALTRSTPLPSICAWPCFLGLASANTKRQ